MSGPETSPLARRHPVLADRLGILLLVDALARGDLAATTDRARRLGFLDAWWIIGPFDNERGTGLDRPQPPEREIDFAVKPSTWRASRAATLASKVWPAAGVSPRIRCRSITDSVMPAKTSRSPSRNTSRGETAGMI